MKRFFCFLLGALIAQSAAATITVKLYSLTAKEGAAKEIGTITAENTVFGLLLTPNLTNLPPGLHGFHLHQLPSCKQAGKAAGGHFDPRKTGLHRGPYSRAGHLGDLPVLYVDTYGNATLPTLAPRVLEKTLLNRSFMIHAGGDNYSDKPAPLGGGGIRIACGVVSRADIIKSAPKKTKVLQLQQYPWN